MSSSSVVVIPSKGVLNGFDGTVKIKEMSVECEKEILSNHTPTEKIINIVSSCVEDCKVSVLELPLVDLLFLLFEIRSLMDKEYEFPILCDYCGFSYKSGVSIPEGFSVKYAADDYKEPVSLKLPGGDEVQLVSFKVKDQLELEKRTRVLMQNRQKGFREGNMPESAEANMRNMQYIGRMIKQIVSINGEKKDTLFLQNYVNKMTMRDSNAIKDFFDNETFGMDTVVKIQCPNCTMEDDFVVPIKPEFFRPRSRRQKETI